jgi:hypothetical protein
MDRVLPVVSFLRRLRPSLPISVDTRRVEVARAALDEGADVVNVVTGLDAPAELLALVAGRGAAIVLNHCRGTPQTTFGESSFQDVTREVASDLADACTRAASFGIPHEKIFLDPGFGFGKKPGENFELLSRLSVPPGRPRGRASRTWNAGRPADRLPESLAAAASLSERRGRTSTSASTTSRRRFVFSRSLLAAVAGPCQVAGPPHAPHPKSRRVEVLPVSSEDARLFDRWNPGTAGEPPPETVRWSCPPPRGCIWRRPAASS